MIKLFIAKLGKYFFLTIVSSLLGFCYICAYTQVAFTDNHLDNQAIQKKFVIKNQKGIPNEDKVFIKEDGWEIPTLAPSKVTRYNQKVYLENKKKVKINVTDYELLDNFITKEPFAFIKKDLGNLLYLTISEYKVKNRIFSYKIQATLAEVDQNTKKIKFTIGVLLFFSFNDENGDGKFESLVLDETFSNTPRIPQWVLK